MGIMSAMRFHMQNDDVQEKGCAALYNLAEGVKDNKLIFAEVGGIQAIIEAMRIERPSEQP